jgi:hypothetical protein
VADNGSDDETADMIRSDFPKTCYKRFLDNPGYGAAVNRVRPDIAEPYFVVLNGDTEIRPGALGALADYLAQHPRAGLVGPLLRHADGRVQPSCYPVASPLQLLLEESRAGALLGRIPWLRQRYLRTWAHDRDRSVPWVLGAAMAVRATAFDSVGGFDESYFLYYEEVDLCQRLRDAGWEVHFTPTAEVIHDGGASTDQFPSAAARTYYASAARFYRSHRSRASWLGFRAVVAAVATAHLLRDGARARLSVRTSPRASSSEATRLWRAVLRDVRTGWRSENPDGHD